MILVETFVRADRAMAAAITWVGDDQRGARYGPVFATHPAEGVPVRDAVAHIARDEAWIPALLAGRTMAEVGSDAFDGDLLGDDPAGAFSRLAAAAQDAALAVTDLDAPVHCSFARSGSCAPGSSPPASRPATSCWPSRAGPGPWSAPPESSRSAARPLRVLACSTPPCSSPFVTSSGPVAASTPSTSSVDAAAEPSPRTDEPQERYAVSTPESGWSFETQQIHAGATPDPSTNARATPIYQTTSYVFRDTQHGSDLFSLAEPGNIYTRIMNPTTDVLEQRVNALEGGVAALAFASGSAATTAAILTIAETGDHLVSSPSLYGGTYNLFHYTLPKMGIEVSFVEDQDDLQQWRDAARPNTKLFFAETLPNPGNNVLDIRGVADTAHEVGVPLLVDNTVPTPYLVRPIEHGADVVIHSATKFLGGHGTSIAGVVVDGGTFAFGEHGDRFPGFTEPDPSYHGLKFWEALGPGAFAAKMRVQHLRDTGAALSPFNAFLILQGIETLSLRMERHVANAQAIAEWLEARDEVEQVWFAGLESSPWHAAQQRYLPRGAGSIVAFELRGGIEAGRAFVDGTTLHSQLANIGDVRSLIVHPASTTHSQLSEPEQRSSGVTPGLVRLSVGIENLEDIRADLEAGFTAAKSATSDSSA